jgi:hypothetical protein
MSIVEFICYKVVEPFSGPCASRSYVHRAALLEGEPWCSGEAVALWPWGHGFKSWKQPFSKNAGKYYVHKTEGGWTLHWTLHKQELRALGCPFYWRWSLTERNPNTHSYNDVTYMFLKKCRQHTVHVTSLSTFSRDAHSVRSPESTSYHWKLFNNLYILWQRWDEPLHIKNIRKIAAEEIVLNIARMELSCLREMSKLEG